MKRGCIVVSCALLLASMATTGQTQTPRTPWGDPDLQGLWSNATLTPLQRPRELGDKEFFTREEAAAYVRQRMEAVNADRDIGQGDSVGSYNDAWFDRGNSIVPTLRTSLIIEPSTGRFPPLTPEAQRQLEEHQAYAAMHPADGPEDRYLTERCIVFGGAAAPMFPEPYNNNYYIVQTPDYVSILVELNHEVRIIPLDGREHFPSDVRQWLGDSRGHWEGDTLVVETTNQKHGNYFYGVQYLEGLISEDFRVVERFTRTGPDQIRYRATVHDPAIFTAPWTVEIFMHPQEGPMVEYACHEGNYGLRGLLQAARADEAAAEADD
jgi:hypothetical protein